jgi:hypothetical protein
MAWVIVDKKTKKVHGTSLGEEKPIKNADLFDVVYMDTEPSVDSLVAMTDKRIKPSPAERIKLLEERVKALEDKVK